MRYIGFIEQGKNGFSIYFPDILGCVSAGDTMEDVVNMGSEALQSHCDILLEDGETLPPPRTLKQLESDPTFGAGLGDDVAVYIPVIPNFGKKKQYGLRLDEALINEVDATVDRLNDIGSRTAFIETAIRDMLQKV